MDEGLYHPPQSCNLLKIFIYFQIAFCLSIIDLYCYVAFKMDSKAIHLHKYTYIFIQLYIHTCTCVLSCFSFGKLFATLWTH